MAAYGGKLIVAKDGLAADHPEHYVNLEATLCERNKVGRRCKLDPSLKAPCFQNFDCEKGITVLST